MTKAIEYFSVFGGLKISVDVSVDIEMQIKDKVLSRYKYLRNDISNITLGDPSHHRILSSLALSDRRTNSAFKKAKISFDNGIYIIDKQCETGMLYLEKSKFSLANQKINKSISEKLFFTTPFAHFWFAFISPIFQGVRDGDFKESLDLYKNHKSEFNEISFNQLSHELLKKIKLKEEDRIHIIGRYWDDNIHLDIIAQTASKKIIIGSTKFINSKVKKTELNRLKDIAKVLNIEVHTYVIFSKKGFSSELKSLKGSSLKLFSAKSFNQLIDK